MAICIDDLLVSKYKKGGRKVETGFDCYGYVIEIEKRFGHIIPDFSELKTELIDYDKCKFIAESKLSDVIKKDKPEKESDLILFIGSNGVKDHVGVYLGNGLFTHCDMHGPHVQRLNSYYKKIGAVYSWQ